MRNQISLQAFVFLLRRPPITLLNPYRPLAAFIVLGLLLTMKSGVGIADDTLIVDPKYLPFAVDAKTRATLDELHKQFDSCGYERANYARVLDKFEQFLVELEQQYPCELEPAGLYAKAHVMMIIAQCYDWLGQPAIAIHQATHATTILSLFDMSSPQMPQYLNLLGGMYWRHGDLGKAQTLLATAETLLKSVYLTEYFPYGNPLVIRLYIDQGQLAAQQGKIDEARVHFESAVKHGRILVSDSGFQDATTASTDYLFGLALRHLAELHGSNREFDKAVSLLKERLVVISNDNYARHSTTASTELIETLHGIGGIYVQLKNYRSSEPYFLQALEMATNSADPGIRAMRFICCVNVSFVAQQQGELLRAQYYCREAIKEQSKDTSGSGASLMALSIAHHRYGSILASLGELPAAVVELKRSLDIQHKIALTQNTPALQRRIALGQADLAEAYRLLGESGKAIACSSEVIDIYNKLFPKAQYPNGTEEFALALQNHGVYLICEDRPQEAIHSLQKALAFRDKLYPNDKRKYDVSRAQMLQITSDAYFAMRDFASAQKTIDESHVALKSYSHNVASYRDHIMSLLRQARLYLCEGRMDEAATTSAQAVDLARKTYTKEVFPHGHELLAKSLEYHSAMLLGQHHHRKSLETAIESAAMRLQFAKVVLPGLSETEALNLVTNVNSMPESLFPSFIAGNEDANKVFEIVWNRRAIVLRILSNLRSDMRRDSIPTKHVKRQRLVTVCRQLAREIEDSGLERDDGWEERMTKLNEEREELERMLVSEHLGARSVEDIDLSPTMADLNVLLKSTDCYIEFVVHPMLQLNPRTTRNHYSAFILSANQPLQYVNLGSCQVIDPAIEKFRRDIEREREWTDSGRQLSRVIWDSIETKIPKGCTNLYLCPDGMLSAVPWAALPDNHGNVLISKRNVVSVPSGQHLCKWLAPKKGRFKSTKVLAIGDVDYGTNYDSLSHTHSDPGISRKNRSAYAALPGTKDEIDAITKYASNWSVTLISGTDATAERIEEELPKVDVAHFATHAFFTGLDNEDNASGTMVDLLSEKYFVTRTTLRARNPLLRSGLILAGFNSRRNDQPGTSSPEALSAYSLSLLPLQDLSLAVLSACETGLGEFAGNEGVIGLQRALHVAGTRNVIGTLWKVEDARTSKLMTLFYRNFFVRRQSPMESLRNAQLEFLISAANDPEDGAVRGRVNFDSPVLTGEEAGQPMPMGPYAHPRYWAAFVLSGPGF